MRAGRKGCILGSYFLGAAAAASDVVPLPFSGPSWRRSRRSSSSFSRRRLESSCLLKHIKQLRPSCCTKGRIVSQLVMQVEKKLVLILLIRFLKIRNRESEKRFLFNKFQFILALFSVPVSAKWSKNQNHDASGIRIVSAVEEMSKEDIARVLIPLS